MRIYNNLTTTKIVHSGAILEVFTYLEKPLYFGNYQDLPDTKFFEKQPPKNTYLNNLKATKKKAQRLIDANCYAYDKTKDKPYVPTMLTLTTRDNIPSLSLTNPLIPLFIKRLNYEILKGKKNAFVNYITIPEWQERGAVHYHMSIFNLPYVKHKDLTDLWGQGFVWITRTDRMRGIGRYMTKYMTKGFDDERLKGHKRYMPSQNLIQPKTIYQQDIAENIKNDLPDSLQVYEKEYQDLYRGKINYKIYDLGNEWKYSEKLKKLDTFGVDDTITEEYINNLFSV
jgi:hypothetical protein